MDADEKFLIAGAIAVSVPLLFRVSGFAAVLLLVIALAVATMLINQDGR